MPSTYDAVRKKVKSDTYAYKRLTKLGLTHKGGVFIIDRPLSPWSWLCLQYLCEEWDYAYKLAPGFKGQVSWYYEIPEQQE